MNFEKVELNKNNIKLLHLFVQFFSQLTKH